MAYVTLPTIATGTLVTADDWNQAGDNFDHLAGMKAGGVALSALAAGSELGLPAGVILPYGGAVAPAGWLLCYGQAISRTTYADLYSAIGTTYGVGDGSTTFNVPDLRGRVPLGKDNMGGSSANRVTATEADNLGQGSGAETHTLITAEMPAHTHTSNYLSSVPAVPLGAGTNAWVGVSGAATSSAGGGGAHNNLQPYLTLNYIIRT